MTCCLFLDFRCTSPDVVLRNISREIMDDPQKFEATMTSALMEPRSTNTEKVASSRMIKCASAAAVHSSSCRTKLVLRVGMGRKRLITS